MFLFYNIIFFTSSHTLINNVIIWVLIIDDVLQIIVFPNDVINNKTMTTFSQTYAYETEYLSLRQLSRVFSKLKSNKSCMLKGRITCSSQSIIDLINERCAKRQHSSPDRLNDEMLGKKDVSVEQAKDMKYKKSIDFQNRLVTKVFINQYKKKLDKFGKEFNIYMQRQGTFIKIYSNTAISPIFQSQILDMKHNLVWKLVADQKLYQKLLYSKYIRMQLENLHIRFIYLFRERNLMLHSSVVNNLMLSQAIDKFSYQAVILQFYSQCYSPLANSLYFRALMYHCQPFLNKIAKTHEIQIQICWKKMGIVMHTPVPIFAQEPKQQLSQFLANIVFVTYYTTRPSEHLLHIKSHQPLSKCVRAIPSREFIFTSWDVSKQITANEVNQIFEMFFQELNIKTNVRIGFRTGGLVLNLMQNVEDLAEKHRFFIEYPEFTQDKQEIMIKFKSFPNRESRLNQISQFLQELLTGKVEAMRQKSETSESAEQDESSNSEKSESQPNPPQMKENNEQNDRYFKYIYQAPQLIECEQFSTKKWQRIRELEELFYSRFGIACKIWNLRIYLPKGTYTKPSGEFGCSLCVVESFEIESGFHVQQPSSKNPESLESGKQYYLISKIESSTPQYLLTHMISVYKS